MLDKELHKIFLQILAFPAPLFNPAFSWFLGSARLCYEIAGEPPKTFRGDI
jgi:hypothetical protein